MVHGIFDGMNGAPESFRLVQLLGQGGFAQTYLAEVIDEDLVREYETRQVALKIPLDKRKQRSVREDIEINAALHKRLRKMTSLNLVRYIGFDVFRNQIVMVMEYVPGGSLRNRVGPIPTRRSADATRQLMKIEDAVGITIGVLTGLEMIHREHILHRDIKPENILMDGDNPKIGDFGISRMMASNELAASTTIGTPFYMAPEAFGEEGASYSSDIWAVGATLYEMLVGRPPFGYADSPIGVLIDLIRGKDPKPPARLRSGISRELDGIVLKTLAKNPGDRYGCPAEMRQALECLGTAHDSAVEEEIAQLMREELPASAREQGLRDLAKRYPDSYRVRQELGELYLRLQRYSKAEKELKAAIHLEQDEALLHWNLGIAYERLGRKREALAEFEGALKLGLESGYRRLAEGIVQKLRAEMG